MNNKINNQESYKDIKIAEKFNTSSLYFFGGTIVLAAMFVFFKDIDSSVSNVSLALSVIALITGIIKASKKVKQYTYLPTNSRVRLHPLYFNMKSASEVTDFLKSHDMELLKKITPLKTGGVLAKLFISDDNKFSLVKSFQYDEYLYRTLYKDETFSCDECKQLREILSI
jgi:hypothetical protein